MVWFLKFDLQKCSRKKIKVSVKIWGGHKKAPSSWSMKVREILKKHTLIFKKSHKSSFYSPHPIKQSQGQGFRLLLSLLKNLSNAHSLSDTIANGHQYHKLLISHLQTPYTPSLKPHKKSQTPKSAAVYLILKKFRPFSNFNQTPP